MKDRTYRYFNGVPLYSFGYGLSYTKFAYSSLKIANTRLHAGDPLMVEVEVKNTGAVPGDEVSQLYLMPPASGNGGLSPRLQLEGFQRVSLQPGESRKLMFDLSPRDLSEVDAEGVRSVQPGEYALAIGGAQPGDIHAPTAAVTGRFTIEGTQTVPR
jgi:beta-glucosidase